VSYRIWQKLRIPVHLPGRLDRRAMRQQSAERIE
jgi:hypothetical protein